MDSLRRPFQGVSNIIRFNWHFYAIAISLIAFLLCMALYFGDAIMLYCYISIVLISLPLLISLIVSFYVYDLSALYNFAWIKDNTNEQVIVNINAGFDETSSLLAKKFKHAQLTVLDFYDPLKHTEVSIKRARKAYPPYPNTKQINTTQLPLAKQSVDQIFVILAAHEIREEAERIAFFKELHRTLKPDGQVFIVEHLRDSANFFAYTVGFLHFYSKSTWQKTFKAAKLNINQELKLTPFISTFILNKNGTTS